MIYVDLPIGIAAAVVTYRYSKNHYLLLDQLCYRYVYKPTIGKLVTIWTDRKQKQLTPPAAAASLDISVAKRNDSSPNSKKGSASSTQINTPLLENT